MSEPIHIISLGAGVQSSTMALMAAKGEITPMPVAAIFADTQAEPQSVYRWLDWLEKQLPFPVLRISRGSLTERALSVRFSKKNNRSTFSGIPAYVKQPNGAAGISPRQCTRDFKIDPITKAVNGLRRTHGNVPAVIWIGISLDEVYRAKEHRNKPRITNRHPLLMELRMTRRACIAWMQMNGYPKPPRSACVYCPYHNNEEWMRLKTEEPEAFAQAVEFEKALTVTYGKVPHMRGVPFLHRSLIPLDQVDFSVKKDDRQANLFNNECEGMCGV